MISLRVHRLEALCVWLHILHVKFVDHLLPRLVKLQRVCNSNQSVPCSLPPNGITKTQNY